MRAEEPGQSTPPETKTAPSLSAMRENAKTGETPIPSPFDAFLALDQISKAKPVNWADVFEYGDVVTDAGLYTDTAEVAMMLGVKVSDGLIAIKAKDTEALNDISRVIEELAKKLGVDQAILDRAEKVRTIANEGDWLGVFLELGFLQENIIEALKKDERKDQRALILASGWVQGARYAAYAIEKNYSENASNLLREPVLIDQLHADLEKTSDGIKANATVKALIAKLAELRAICDITKEGVIPVEKVAALRATCDELVKMMKK
jgi:hypothetical protein